MKFNGYIRLNKIVEEDESDLLESGINYYPVVIRIESIKRIDLVTADSSMIYVSDSESIIVYNSIDEIVECLR